MRKFTMFAVGTALAFGMSGAALADDGTDVKKGEEIFNANCVACHAGGGNVMIPEGKSLSKADLEANGKFGEDAIIAQVANGSETGMTAFGTMGILEEEDIKAVAKYVLKQAEKGWE